MRKPYPTDLSDAEWSCLEEHLPAPQNYGRPRVHSWREILNAIFYIVRGGCPWRLLPHEFPPWKTVYHYFRSWRLDGTWERLHRALRGEAVKAPRPTYKEMRTLSAKETRRLLDAARGDRLEALYVLAVHTGMRQGELLALKWSDVDLENATISVRRTITKSGTHLLLGEPKTKKSRRTIHLTEVATEALRDHLQRQMEEMEHLGDLYEDHGLVFTTEVGSLINPTNLRKRSFAALLKHAELPLVRFHDLRHTCATLLFSRGVHPKYVQELLGHANISITLDRYSHVIPGMGDHTARAMEDALS
jgi:integrase